MFQPFQTLKITFGVGQATRLAGARATKAPPGALTITYAFAATSIGVVSSAIPGPMLELR